MSLTLTRSHSAWGFGGLGRGVCSARGANDVAISADGCISSLMGTCANGRVAAPVAVAGFGAPATYPRGVRVVGGSVLVPARVPGTGGLGPQAVGAPLRPSKLEGLNSSKSLEELRQSVAKTLLAAEADEQLLSQARPQTQEGIAAPRPAAAPVVASAAGRIAPTISIVAPRSFRPVVAAGAGLEQELSLLRAHGTMRAQICYPSRTVHPAPGACTKCAALEDQLSSLSDALLHERTSRMNAEFELGQMAKEMGQMAKEIESLQAHVSPAPSPPSTFKTPVSVVL